MHLPRLQDHRGGSGCFLPTPRNVLGCASSAPRSLLLSLSSLNRSWSPMVQTLSMGQNISMVNGMWFIVESLLAYIALSKLSAVSLITPYLNFLCAASSVNLTLWASVGPFTSPCKVSLLLWPNLQLPLVVMKLPLLRLPRIRMYLRSFLYADKGDI